MLLAMIPALLAGLVLAEENLPLLNDSEIMPLYAQWGRSNETRPVEHITAAEAYYSFNISNSVAQCDQSNLASCDLFDPIGTIKEYQDYDVLVHFLICRDGTIIQLAPVENITWHARGFNNDTVGVRIIALNETVAAEYSRQTGKKIAPGPNEIQYRQFARLIATLKTKYPGTGFALDYRDIKGNTVANSTIDWSIAGKYLRLCGFAIENKTIKPLG